MFLLVWLGALIGYLSKGYFKPYRAPASPIAVSRRITFDQVSPPHGKEKMIRTVGCERPVLASIPVFGMDFLVGWK